MTDRHTRISSRFRELAAQGKSIPTSSGGSDAADAAAFYAWATSVLNLFHGALGSTSPHTLRFQSELDSIGNNYVSPRHLNAIRGIFEGAKSDFDGGHFFDMEAAITAEVFGDFVASAKAALAEGHHSVAAVLASAALEDTLKRFAISAGLDATGKSMSDIVNALKSKGLVSGAQKSLLGSMPKIRDYAMHAEWEKLTPQDAGSIIGYVEQFLLTQFPQS